MSSGHTSTLSLAEALNSENSSSSSGGTGSSTGSISAEECIAEVNNWTRSFWTLRNACTVASLAVAASAADGGAGAASDAAPVGRTRNGAWCGNSAQAAVRQHGLLALGVAFALAAVDVAPPEQARQPLSHCSSRSHENPPPPSSSSSISLRSSEASHPGRSPSEDDLLRAALDRALLGCLQVLLHEFSLQLLQKYYYS